MPPSTILLIASLGAILIILAIHVNIFVFERRAYLVMWFIGWAAIGANYALDAFFPGILRGNPMVFAISAASYVFANLLIFCGIYNFLEIKINKALCLGGMTAWLAGFAVLEGFLPGFMLITYANAAVFVLTCMAGIVMIRAGRKHGRLAVFLGTLHIVWVICSILFSYILKLDHIMPYAVMHGIQLINATGLIQLCFKTQKGEIERGLAHIKHLSEHDELTGLYNKSYFDAKLRALDQAEDCLPVSLIVGDMNGLKFVNDVFGHQEGDCWIRRAALLLKENCRKDDIVTRWGGDEFAVILSRTELNEAALIVDRIRAACAFRQETEIPVSISLGLAVKTGRESSLSDVFKAAEKAMYEMKLVEGKKARSVIIKTIEARMVQKGLETKERLERLRRLAVEFAQVLGLPADRQADLLMAVKYREAGKIALAEEVLLKEGCLKEQDWTTLKKHVEIGYRIICAFGGHTLIADAVLYQHEWWNGQGFPQGLCGEEIPVMSRILSILHAFDQIAGYQQAAAGSGLTAKALEALRRDAGVKFDPDLVEQFAGMIAVKAVPPAVAEAGAGR